MSEAIITVEHLGKKYRIQHQAQRQRYTALRDVLADRTKSVARRLWSSISVFQRFRFSASSPDVSMSAFQRFRV
jgi:hypothetical protein